MLVINCVQYEQGQSVYRLYKYALQCIVGAEGIAVCVSVVRVVSVILISLPDSLILLILYCADSLSRICSKSSLQ